MARCTHPFYNYKNNIYKRASANEPLTNNIVHGIWLAALALFYNYKNNIYKRASANEPLTNNIVHGIWLAALAPFLQL